MKGDQTEKAGSFEGAEEKEMEEAIRGEREVGEESSKPKVRNAEAVPSEREVEEHNVDHGVFRSWCPHCVKDRAKAYGHKKIGGDGGDALTVSLGTVGTQKGDLQG